MSVLWWLLETAAGAVVVVCLVRMCMNGGKWK